MIGYVILLGGMLLFATIFTVLDGIAYRRRRAAERAAEIEAITGKPA